VPHGEADAIRGGARIDAGTALASVLHEWLPTGRRKLSWSDSRSTAASPSDIPLTIPLRSEYQTMALDVTERTMPLGFRLIVTPCGAL